MTQVRTRAAPGHRRTQDQRVEEMRARLLEAAVKVMLERGYAGFRVAEVAETAGVSRGGQIHHFPTKDLLVIAALERVYDLVAEQSVAALDALSEDDNLVQALVDDAARFFFSDNFLIALDILMAGGKDARLRDAAIRVAGKHRLLLEASWAARFTAKGLSEEAAKDLVWTVQSAVRGFAIRRLISFDSDRESHALTFLQRLVDRYMVDP